ncbi:flagellar hook assembly protein FlgD [Pseudodesulfovibrio indicus]|jgi:flagellar basal-body rod modification protein FlgD|uniref:Basal-body rod modification protein FlgD n=1 Tax=Pseudodesulfovibrio indicus TaxID=1716143 RepID=A0A126QS72_9BACT|nr:flagellar hook assembly protein FlgD [Pseudodesulfovibrio indicus]AMK12587.1 flagellar hook capping protein [Pseudodesulfovibrio indicus]TDT90897.1 flagellar basal-body rod modification protein FlgD [Pseudodesulfovibrio indicus]
MTVDATSYYDTLISSTAVASTTTESSTSLTSEDFITLLCTELQYQDPTEPLDNSQMVDQMTQYSQLEELADLNDKMDSLNESIEAMGSAYGLDYLGKQVEANGHTIAKHDDDISTLYLTLDDDAAELTINIYNSEGKIVESQIYADVDSGTVAFQWDGTDYDGNEVSNGQYYIIATATDAEGDSVGCTSTTTGTVTGVSNTENGVVLTLSDGRSVYLADVTYATS